MKRRRLLIATLALPAFAARAQQPGAIRRVGLVTIGAENATDWILGIREGLHEQRFVEGSNLKFEYRTGLGGYEQLLEAAKEHVKSKVDVIATFGDTATRAAIKASATIPIVMSVGTDPVEAGFVASLARPGGNVTGVTLFAQTLIGKRLEILKETLPGLKTVAVLVNPGSQGSLDSFRLMETAAKSLGLRLNKAEFRAPQDIEPAITAAAKAGAGALSAVPSTMLLGQGEAVARAAIANRLPTMITGGRIVDAGGLMSYSAKLSEGFRRQGYNIGRILKGDKPANLPVEQPTHFELVINMKTARALGITIPPSVMVRAERVIE